MFLNIPNSDQHPYLETVFYHLMKEVSPQDLTSSESFAMFIINKMNNMLNIPGEGSNIDTDALENNWFEKLFITHFLPTINNNQEIAKANMHKTSLAFIETFKVDEVEFTNPDGEKLTFNKYKIGDKVRYVYSRNSLSLLLSNKYSANFFKV
tara:strand:- start:85 stop:540 length:456 start_codon:yes stop_codon:yes gene_type:complete